MCQGGHGPQLAPRPPDPLLELLTDPGRPTARLIPVNKESEGKCRLDIIIYYLLYLFTYPRVPYLKHGVENTLGVIGIKWFFIVDVIKKSKGVQCKVYQGFDVDEAA